MMKTERFINFTNCSRSVAREKDTKNDCDPHTKGSFNYNTLKTLMKVLNIEGLTSQ